MHDDDEYSISTAEVLIPQVLSDLAAGKHPQFLGMLIAATALGLQDHEMIEKLIGRELTDSEFMEYDENRINPTLCLLSDDFETVGRSGEIEEPLTVRRFRHQSGQIPERFADGPVRIEDGSGKVLYATRLRWHHEEGLTIVSDLTGQAVEGFFRL